MHIKSAVDHKRQLVRIIMAVPNKLTSNTRKLYMVIIKRGYAFRFPRLINKLQFLQNRNRLYVDPQVSNSGLRIAGCSKSKYPSA
ncbi:MAG: hypothetical protein ACI9P7_001736 [Candidatus Azotimanducaceae bacterium]|jgi:hypothetical protein